MRPRNPYADLAALVDSTRELTPEEVAELQLEQGYADRALVIFDALLAEDPDNAYYRRRRDWLARLAAVRQRPVRCVSSGTAPPPDSPDAQVGGQGRNGDRGRDRDGTRQVGAAIAGDGRVERTLRGVVPPGGPRRGARRSTTPPPPAGAPSSAPPAAVVQRRAIVGVG